MGTGGSDVPDARHAAHVHVHDGNHVACRPRAVFDGFSGDLTLVRPGPRSESSRRITMSGRCPGHHVHSRLDAFLAAEVKVVGLQFGR